MKNKKSAQQSTLIVTSLAAERLRWFERKREELVQTIVQLVEIESPSREKASVDKLSALLAGRFEGVGGHAKFHHVVEHGDHLQVDFPGRGKPVLLLGHLDTVYPL